MKIGIIAPSPVPFGIGGAEKFYWGLQEHINKNTAHQCELIKIPVKEDNFWNLIDSYYKFYTLDVSYFDAVIVSKYPAWLVPHPNKHIYMLHCLRGLYDTYHMMNLPFGVETGHSGVDKILKYIGASGQAGSDGPAGSTADGLFRMLFGLKNDETAPAGALGFPGPFIRKIIHFLDKKAMESANSFSAISKTVAERKEYFPDKAAVSVIYPPSNLKGFKNGNFEYFFTASRLDGPKRVKTIIEAYLEADTDIPLKIAGTGPLAGELKELSRNVRKIEFLGFISDKDLIDYYANALAVIFIPYEEDLGLVAVEAMMSGKAVITFADSGGVKEFVENGKTGFICEPSARRLKDAIEAAGGNAALTAEMGARAKEKVKGVTWENAFNVLECLIEAARGKSGEGGKSRGHGRMNEYAGVSDTGKNITARRSGKRKKITVAATYPVFPPRGGGQNRIFYLYKELAAYIDVELVTLGGENEAGFSREIAPNLVETRTPKSASFAAKEFQIEQKLGIPATDIAMLYHHAEAKEYSEAVKRAAAGSDAVISSCPYPYYVLKKYSGSFLIYDSQNVEYLLKKQMASASEDSGKILSELFESEKEVCLNSGLITVCATDDAFHMQKLYGLDLERTLEVPNGADLETVKFFPPEKRKALKNGLGLGREKIVLFIGSWHQPNIDAAKKIFAFAEKLNNFKFIILGSAGEYFKHYKIPRPSNVGFAGVAQDCEKALYLSAADLAVNPMLSGSGTNLKMLDYMAAGVPVASTAVGARGLRLFGDGTEAETCGAGECAEKTPRPDNLTGKRGAEDNGFIKLAEIDEFSEAVAECMENYGEEKIYRARAHVELNFDWKTIAEKFKNKLAGIL